MQDSVKVNAGGYAAIAGAPAKRVKILAERVCQQPILTHAMLSREHNTLKRNEDNASARRKRPLHNVFFLLLV